MDHPPTGINPGLRPQKVPIGGSRTPHYGIRYKRPQTGVTSPAPAPAVPFNPVEHHKGTGPKASDHFTHEEMSHTPEHDVRQSHADLPKLYEHAAAYKEWMDEKIDRGKGLSVQLGLHVVEGRSVTPEDFAEGHKRGGMVLMAPLKGEKRAREKVEQKGVGFDHLKDLSRATVAVSHPDDIAHVTHRLRQAGFPLAGAPDYKVTPAGYQDITVRPHHPETGHVGELQIMPIDMLHAKQHGFSGIPGHALYEEMRAMTPEELETPQGKARYEHLNAQSNALYGEAVRRMESRQPQLHAKGQTMKGVTRVKAHTRRKRSHFHHPDVARKGQHALAPGYFSWEGHPAMRRERAGWPVYLVDGQWKRVPDLSKFDHEAAHVDEQRFLAMLRRHTGQNGKLGKALAMMLLLKGMGL